MKPPVRDQISGVVDPIRTPIGFDPDEDKTRQEFREEADVNNILRRGAGANLFARQAKYGVQDFSIDLQVVREATRRALEGFSGLPEAVRQRYGTQAALLQGLALGELILTSDGLIVPEPAAAEAAAGSGTGQSEAAADSGAA